MLVCTNLTYELTDAGDGYDIIFPTYPAISGYIEARKNFAKQAVAILRTGFEAARQTQDEIPYEPISDVTGGQVRGAVAIPNWVILKIIVHNIMLTKQLSITAAAKLSGHSVDSFERYCSFVHSSSEAKLLIIIKSLGVQVGVTNLYHYSKVV